MRATNCGIYAKQIGNIPKKPGWQLTYLTFNEETGGSRPPYGIAEWAGSISAK
jgi:hypothetical protein